MSNHLYPRLKIFLTLLLFATAAPAHAQNTQTEEKPADGIRGIVINSVTHEPIGRALVYSPDNRFATMTNSEGRFEFTLAQPEEGNENKSVPANSTTMTQCVGDSCTTYSSNGGQSRPTQLMARKPGFLNDPNSTPNYLTIASENVSSAGTYQNQFSISPSDGWQAVILGLPASGGGGTPAAPVITTVRPAKRIQALPITGCQSFLGL